MTAYEAGGKGKREKEEEKAPPAGNGNGRGITDMNQTTAKTPRTGAPLLTAGEMLHAVQNGELDTMLEMLGGERDLAGRRARCAEELRGNLRHGTQGGSADRRRTERAVRKPHRP